MTVKDIIKEAAAKQSPKLAAGVCDYLRHQGWGYEQIANYVFTQTGMRPADFIELVKQAGPVSY